MLRNAWAPRIVLLLKCLRNDWDLLCRNCTLFTFSLFNVLFTRVASPRKYQTSSRYCMERLLLHYPHSIPGPHLFGAPFGFRICELFKNLCSQLRHSFTVRLRVMQFFYQVCIDQRFILLPSHRSLANRSRRNRAQPKIKMRNRRSFHQTLQADV